MIRPRIQAGNRTTAEEALVVGETTTIAAIGEADLQRVTTVTTLTTAI